jgi:hypothetical protein
MNKIKKALPAKRTNMDNLSVAAERFALHGKVTAIEAYGKGNINDTFLVTIDSKVEKHFILQRINTQVFRQPELIIRNMLTITEHVRKRLQHAPLSGNRRWEIPHVLLTKDNRDHWIDPGGSFWRAISFIEAAQSFDTIRDIKHAGEVGYALGTFHSLISDLPAEKLADTLKGFHVMPSYLRHYNEVLKKNRAGKSPEVDYCLQFISKRRDWAHVLENARLQGRLHLRTIHGDPKVNNVMMDTAVWKAVSIVDLDTVKPGLIHYDIGDCLRSGCNPVGEETDKLETIRFDTDICKAILKGYLPAARDFLTGNDYEYLYEAIRLIAFDLGLRFFTDYLEGNVYFKIRHKEHNLSRALVQFKLTESIESQEAAIRAIIRDLR